MSGFVAILHLDGAPVDRALLDRMTRSLDFRGPDAMGVWCEGAVGLGHTLLRATPEASPDDAIDKQPAVLDGRLWIVADARIDARAELIANLKAKSSAAGVLSPSTPDAQLILHAYDVWGDACVEHLIGDFSFVIWDARARRLFCARDHFGIKCFYYARAGNFLSFSNTLDCLRLHPGVSDRLNELAIADFLLFESSQEPGDTAFSDIARLEPAHTLQLNNGTISERCFWTLPVSEPFPHKHPMECVKRFQELMDTAVADRVRTGPAGVLMSGGLDSSIVAASAQRVFLRAGLPARLRAYTQVFDSLVPHDERHYAGLVADALQIPVAYQTADGYQLFDGAVLAENATPEPANIVWAAPQLDQLRELGKRDRVALSGLGADPVLSCQLSVHFRQLIKQGEFVRAAAEAFRFLRVENRWSRLYIEARWRLFTGKDSSTVQFPDWVNPEFERRTQLRQRFGDLVAKLPDGKGVRPVAYSVMASAMWPRGFELMDPGVTHCAVEICHPFFDVRLVDFLLSLPALPWCSDKELLREAGRGVLPDEVRLRRKTPLRQDPVLALLRQPGSEWIDRFDAAPGLERYVIKDRIPPVFQERDAWTAYINLRPLCLNYWLQSVSRVRYKQTRLC